MLMLLSVHVTSVLFLVRFNIFTLTMELHALTQVARSYALLVYTCTYMTVHPVLVSFRDPQYGTLTCQYHTGTRPVLCSS